MKTTYASTGRPRADRSQVWQILGAMCALVALLVASAQAQPVVSFEITPLASEADEAPTVVMTLTAEGEIPEPLFDAEGNLIAGGLSVLFDGGPDLNSFIAQLITFTADGAQLGNFFDPANPTLVEVVLLQNTATFTFPVFDDLAQEEDVSFTFSIVDDTMGFLNSDYLVNPDASTATVTITDGDGGPGVGPTVGFNVTRRMLNEGDLFVVNFTVDGTIPPEGVQVLVASPTVGAIGDFAIFNEDGTPAISFTGLADFPEVGDGVGSSFIVTIIEPTASLTLGVFDDGPTEGLETLTFDLVDGEVYEVNPELSSVTVNINDGGEMAMFEVASGVTSVALDLELLESATGFVLLGAESDGMPFSDEFQVGFNIAEATDFSFAPVPFTPLSGSIEHTGTITLGRVGTSSVTLGNLSIRFDPARVSETTSGFFVADTLDDALGLEVLFDVSPPGMVSVARGQLEVSDANLLVAPELAAALGQPELAGIDIGDARIDAMVTLTAPAPAGSASN